MKKLNYKMMNLLLSSLLLSVVFALNSCRAEDLITEEIEEITISEELPDWSEETHGSAIEPNYSMVFKQNEVLRFDIVISSDDWSVMQDDLDENLGSSGFPGGPGGPPGGGMDVSSDFDPVWVPCSVTYNDTEWYHVGIRYKGNSSLQSTYTSGLEKFSFKLDFDEFESDYPAIKDQRFYGFSQLNLKNNYQDASMVREKVASDLFLDFGIVSPQTSFCVIYVDFGSGPVYYGVYTLVEEVDDTVLDSQFDLSEGNLYKPDGDAASFASGTYNDGEMEKKNNDEIADYSDVYSLYTTLNSDDRKSDTALWQSLLGSVVDIDIFLQWLAANTVMQNWDTYGIMTHNYYLYNNPENGLLTWIPWDNNEALQEGKQGGALSFSLDEVGSNWPLISYLMDIPQYKERYQYYMLEFAEEVFTSEKMTSLYNNYYDLLKEYAYAEIPGYSFLQSDASFDYAIDALKTHVADRNTALESFLDL